MSPSATTSKSGPARAWRCHAGFEVGGTKFDNLVHLGHNVEIGEDCFLIAQTGIAGSTKAGNHVIFAGQTGCTGHITIGDNAVFAGKTGITGNIKGNQVYAGFPACSRYGMEPYPGLFEAPAGNGQDRQGLAEKNRRTGKEIRATVRGFAYVHLYEMSELDHLPHSRRLSPGPGHLFRCLFLDFVPKKRKVLAQQQILDCGLTEDPDKAMAIARASTVRLADDRRSPVVSALYEGTPRRKDYLARQGIPGRAQSQRRKCYHHGLPCRQLGNSWGPSWP